VWGFIDFQVVNYLIFREKVQEFSPRSPQWLALFEGKKVQKPYFKRVLPLFSKPYLFSPSPHLPISHFPPSPLLLS
jgi:hypothetical protein